MVDSSYNTVDPMLLGQKGSTHSSPYYTHSQLYTPKRLRDLFKWCEFLFYNSSHVYAALRKFGEYPITELTYNTTNDALKQKHKYLLEKVIGAKEMLIQASLDKYIYGNSFISMYQPFIRYLRCPHCNSRANIQNTDYKFNVKALSFSFTCRSCNKIAKVTEKGIEDRKLILSRKINFIRWDPKKMDIDHNPITGQSTYYYDIPRDVVKKVNEGHKSLIDSLPLGFLKAIQKGKHFRFAPDAIYHMKVSGPAGINPQWGLPPLLAAMPSFYYASVLRKANEAIALDHVLPFRIVHPAQQSGNADPIQTISLRNWKSEMQSNYKQFRRDPLHILWSPVPVGMTQIGGQGRALLTLGEVQEATKDIVSSLGIPMEFLYGGLSKSGMEITLRLLENQLATHIFDLKGLLQWISDSCARFLGWEQLRVSMTEFRMVDDYQRKNLITQIWQAGKAGQGPQVVSNTLMAELYDIDISKEKDRIKQETLDDVRQQKETELEVTKLQNNLAMQVQQQAYSQQGMEYDQQSVITNADSIVQELMGMDHGSRKSRLHQLQVEDFVLYSVVIQRLEQQQTNAAQQSGAM